MAYPESQSHALTTRKIFLPDKNPHYQYGAAILIVLSSKEISMHHGIPLIPDHRLYIMSPEWIAQKSHLVNEPVYVTSV